MTGWFKRLWKLDVSIARWLGIPEYLMTLSAWAYLSEQEGGFGKISRPIIDWGAYILAGQTDHCKAAYLKELVKNGSVRQPEREDS